MKLINNYCDKIADTLNLTVEQKEIIIFGAESAVSTLYSFGLTVALSLILGVFPIMLMTFIPFAIMKSFAGGAHCKTMTNCAIFSAVTFSIAAKLVEIFPIFFILYERYILSVTLILSLVFYILWAPAQVPEKPISKEYGKTLRLRTFVSISVIGIILIVIHLRQPSYAYPLIAACCIGIMMQSLAITPLAFKLMDGIDYILTAILQRG